MNVDRINMTIANIEANSSVFSMAWPGTCIMGFTSDYPVMPRGTWT